MKIQLIALSLCMLASTNLVKGQGFTPSSNPQLSSSASFLRLNVLSSLN